MRKRIENVRHTKMMWNGKEFVPMWRVLREIARTHAELPETISFKEYRTLRLPIDIEIALRRIYLKAQKSAAGRQPITITHDHDKQEMRIERWTKNSC